MNDRQINKRIKDIKVSLSEYLERKKEAATHLDLKFRELFEEINGDHRRIVDMVKAAKYELTVKQLEEEDEGPDIDDEFDEEA